MATYDAGRVVLTVWPSFDGVQQKIGRESAKWGRDAGKGFTTAFNREVAAAPTVNPGPSDSEAAKQGNDAGKAYGAGFRSGVGSGGPTPIPGPSPTQSREQGQRSGGAYGDAFRRQLELATRALPRIELPMATTEAKQKVRDLRADLERLSGQRIGIDVDAATAEAEIERLLGQLRTLSAESGDIQVKADTAAAVAKLEGLQEQLRRLSGEDASVKVDLDLQDGSFSARVKQAIERAQASLPRIEIDADTSDAEVQIQRIRVRLETLGTKRIGVDVSAADAAAQITRLQERLERLQAGTTDVRVRADAAAAAAELAAVQAQVDRLNGSNARVDVDSTSINTFSGRIVLLGNAIASLAPALLPIGGIAITSLGAIGAAATTAVPAIATLVLGFQGVGEALKQMTKVQDESAGSAMKNSAAAQQQAQAQEAAARQVESASASLANAQANAAQAEQRAGDQIAQAQQNVAKAREAAARSAADSQRRVLDAQAGVAEAEESAADAVAAANKRVTQARDDAARSAEQAARRVADAQRDLQDAQDASDESAISSAKRVTQAREALTQATTDGTQRVAAALRRQEDAERDYSDALKTERDLQRDLVQARKDAQDQLEDLSFRVRQGALDQQQAVIDLAEAQADYNKVQGDGKASDAAREQARIRFEEAKLQLEQLQVENERLAEQQADASSKGVDGSDQVTSAQERIAAAVRARADAEQAARDASAGVDEARAAAAASLADAEERLADASAAQLQSQADGLRRVGDAQVALGDAVNAQTLNQTDSQARIADATEALTKAQEDGAKRVADAQQKATDAVAAAEQSRLDGLERIATAQASVGQAAAAQAEQQRTSAFSLEQAERSLQGAREAAADAAAGGADAATAAMQNLDTAMGKLSPLQQSFTEFLFGLGPQIGRLQNASAAGLLPGVQRGIEALLPLMPTFERLATTFGTALGGLFERAGESLAGPEFQRFYTFLETQGPGILSSLGTLVGSVFSVFNGLAQAFGPIAAQTISSLAGLTQRFADFLHTAGDNKSFQDFLGYVKENTPAVMEFLGSLADAFVNIIRSMAPFGPVVLGVIGFLADMIAAVPPGVLAAIALAVTGIVTAFTILGPVIGFIAPIIAGITAGLPVLGVVIGALGGPVTLVVAGLVILGAVLLAAWKHSETFREAVYKIGDAFTWLWEKASDLGNAIFDGILWPFRNPGVIWDGIKAGFFFLLDAVKDFLGIHSPSRVFMEIGEFLIAGLLAPFSALGALASDLFGGFLTAVQNGVTSALGWLAENWTLVIAIVGGPLGTLVALVIENWDAIKTAISDAWTWIRDQVLLPLGQFFTVDVPGFFSSAVAAIGGAWDMVMDTVRKPLDWLRDNVLLPYFTFYTVTVPSWFGTAVDGVARAWEWIKDTIRKPLDWLRDSVLLPYFTFYTVTVPSWFGTAVGGVAKAWDWIKDTIQKPLDWVRDNVLLPYFTFWTVTVPGWFGTAITGIATAWNKLGGTISSAIDWVRTNIFDPWSTFLTQTIPGYFATAVDAIGAAWDLVKTKAKEPIRFIIETVINKGIVDGFNWIAGKVGVPADKQLQPFALPDGFARGGVLPGTSSWRDGDDQLYPVRRGEGIAVSEAMQVPEAREQLLAWNRLGVQGGASAVRQYMRGAQGFARGGVVGMPLPAGHGLEGFARGGTVDSLLALSRKIVDKFGVRISENRAWGDNPAPGDHSAGGWHYKLGNSGAVDVNLGFGNPKGESEILDKVVGYANEQDFRTIWKAEDHFDHAHIDLGEGRSIGSKGSASGILDKIGDALGGAWDFLSGLSPVQYLKDKVAGLLGGVPGSGAAVDIAKAVPGKLIDTIGDKAMSLLSSFGDTSDVGEPSSGSSGGGAGVERWRSTALQALNLTGYPTSMVSSLLRRMNQESSGDPGIVNTWDSNWKKGTPSVGLMQVIGPTYKRWIDKAYDRGPYKYGTSVDPLANIIASIRYAANFDGNPAHRWDRKGGYALGGIVGDGMFQRIPALAALGLQPFGPTSIPAMAAGGVVRATPGGTVVRLAEAGRDEAVVDAGLLNTRLMELEGLTASRASSFDTRQLDGVGARRQEQLGPLLRELVDLATAGNDIADSGLSQLAQAISDQPRRTQTLQRQGA